VSYIKYNFLTEIRGRVRFWKNADRIGPDIPYTHWMLHFKSTMLTLCKRKFKYFHETAEFRPGAYAICCSKISLGHRVVIRPATMLFADPREKGASIIIEDDVMLGSGVHIYVHNHHFDNPNIPIIDQGYDSSADVILKKGCWIGANSVILSGVTIGENAVVGAGSIVTKSIPDKVVAAGNPARVIRYIGETRMEEQVK
jgi:acetyltransferase-like isoleucine patch superfamily enzyme